MKLTLTLGLWLWTASLAAQVIISPELYTFPKVEPLKAAISTTFLGQPNGKWIEIKMPLLRRGPLAFPRDRRISFRYLYPSKKQDLRELVYILSGFGADAANPKSNFLARKLADEGFHVIILPSIFTAEFVAAASSEGVVGEFERDAPDYYRLMQAATEAIKSRVPGPFKRKHMVGYSYGALTAAFVARIDKREKYFNLSVEALINPPTNLLSAARILDEYSLEREKMGQLAFLKLALRVGAVSLYYRRYIPDLNVYRSYLSKIPMVLSQAKALVGTSLSSTLPEVTEAAKQVVFDQRGNLGGIRPVMGKLTFDAYFKNALVAYSRANHYPHDTVETINERNSLYVLEDYFIHSDNIYLIHNQDDFLLQKGDIEYFSRVFGDRFTLYPWGGHMGNLWHDQNIEGLIALIKGSPRWPGASP